MTYFFNEYLCNGQYKSSRFISNVVLYLLMLKKIKWPSYPIQREEGMEENSLYHYHLYLPRSVGLEAKSSHMLSYTYREKGREKEYLITIEERRERERETFPSLCLE